MHVTRSMRQPEEQAESPPPRSTRARRAAPAPQVVPLKAMKAFFDMLRAIPTQQPTQPQLVPIDPRQAQLINFTRVGVVTFDGRQDPITADKWIHTIKRVFDTMGIFLEYRVSFVALKFEGEATTWWETISFQYDIIHMDQATFEQLFQETYFNINHHRALATEFEALTQGNMTVLDYYHRFMELAQYSRALIEKTMFLISKFTTHLCPTIRDKLATYQFDSMVDCLVVA